LPLVCKDVSFFYFDFGIFHLKQLMCNWRILLLRFVAVSSSTLSTIVAIQQWQDTIHCCGKCGAKVGERKACS
jgi:NADH pyrophosphatase NudC (nudix superfamily)